ncbi:peroxiredoxin [Microcella sp.]|uniref:peroxiredoxin n=1 Tax=Microcella sp. TaxID=1913979 RepID=UPI003919A96D
MPSLEIGQQAPNFTLPGVTVTDGRAQQRHFSLRDMRGAPVVLAFYPADNSPGCTAQLCSYQSELAGFEELGAQVWGISRQDAASHEAFALRQGLTFPLLADEKGDVVERYGVSMFGMGVRRSIFIIDADGVLRWKHVALVGMTFQSARTIREQLRMLDSASDDGAARDDAAS